MTESKKLNNKTTIFKILEKVIQTLSTKSITKKCG